MHAPPLSVAMLLADARLPSGAHVSSNGLEPALRDGLDPRDVPRYMTARMRTAAQVEAGTAVVARANPDRLDEVQQEWAARTPSPALREISITLGAGLLRLAKGLWPGAEILSALPRTGYARPVVLGAVAAVAGLGAADLARVVAYDDAQTVAAALLKLEPLEPAVAARWVLDACARFEPTVPVIAGLTLPEAIPASGAPQIEEWAEAHSADTRRLFRA